MSRNIAARGVGDGTCPVLSWARTPKLSVAINFFMLRTLQVQYKKVPSVMTAEVEEGFSVTHQVA